MAWLTGGGAASGFDGGDGGRGTVAFSEIPQRERTFHGRVAIGEGGRDPETRSSQSEYGHARSAPSLLSRAFA
jgi:hypothetical protein